MAIQEEVNLQLTTTRSTGVETGVATTTTTTVTLRKRTTTTTVALISTTPRVGKTTRRRTTAVAKTRASLELREKALLLLLKARTRCRAQPLPSKFSFLEALKRRPKSRLVQFRLNPRKSLSQRKR